MRTPTGVLVMAYGTASGPDDIERYYTDIRGGRAPSPELLAELRKRYEEIGDRFPLLDITREQAAGLERELNAEAPGSFRTYLGMKHSAPTIEEAVAQMQADGVERAVGIVMAPHWSGMSVETYVQRVEALTTEFGPECTFVRSFHDHPGYTDLLVSRVRDAITRLPQDALGGLMTVYSAHSLPVRTLDDGSQRCLRCNACDASCRYADGLRRTAELVATRVDAGPWMTAWQSAGRTADPWWGPPIERVIADLGARGHSAVLVCSAGFVADHLEILYDLDILARGIAEDAGMAFARTEMPNADPVFTRMLADVVREHLAA